MRLYLRGEIAQTRSRSRRYIMLFNIEGRMGRTSNAWCMIYAYQISIYSNQKYDPITPHMQNSAAVHYDCAVFLENKNLIASSHDGRLLRRYATHFLIERITLWPVLLPGPCLATPFQRRFSRLLRTAVHHRPRPGCQQ